MIFLSKKNASVLLGLFFTHLALAITTVQDIDFESHASGFKVTPKISIKPEPAVIDAIRNGIAVSLIIKVKSFASRRWWFDQEIEGQEQTLSIQYLSLSSQFTLKNSLTQEQLSFTTLSQLLEYCGNQITFTLIKSEPAGVDYLAARLVLDSSALPSSMQLPILFDSDWDLDSEWHYQAIR